MKNKTQDDQPLVQGEQHEKQNTMQAGMNNLMLSSYMYKL